MLTAEHMEFLSNLREEECICIEKHSEKWYNVVMDHGKAWLRSNNELYCIKEISIKSHGKYTFKATCKEMGADVQTIKMFRLTAYKKWKNG